MKALWLFPYCKLDRVIDGDSFVLDIDTGFYHSAKVHVRLRGVDTPERGRNPEGWRQAREFVENWIGGSSTLSFACTGHDKYGRRWLGTVRNSLGESLSDALIDAGLGVVYDGGRKL